MNKIFRVLIFLFLAWGFFGWAGSASAADHFIRQGATGANNGSDWINAWTTLPATLTRGDTYYIADGTYGSYTFDDPVSGELYITIKKAIESDHGTETGWDAVYGDGQAVFGSPGGFRVISDYWIIDGNDDTGWGFVLNYANGIIPNCAYGIYINGAHYVSISSVFAQGDSNPNDDRGTYISGSSDVVLAHIQVSNGGKDFNLITNSNNITYDDFWVHDGNPYPGEHCDAWEIQPPLSNVTWKNSYIDYGGQLIFWGGTPPVTTYSDFWVYNNIFTGPSPVASNVGLKGRDPSMSYINNLYVYGNTFVNIYRAFELGLGSGDIRNNLIYNTTAADAFGDASHDYNSADYALGEANSALLSGDPFVDSANGDFHLAAATDAGITLASPYNSDLEGIIRGADGVWDRGAYEYVGGDITSPAAPTSLSVI